MIGGFLLASRTPRSGPVAAGSSIHACWGQYWTHAHTKGDTAPLPTQSQYRTAHRAPVGR
eukprot:2853906-Rhodomonas_salina.1